MAEKKGFWASLFSGKSKGGCCDMKIVDEDEPKKKGGCCDMKIVEDEDSEKDGCR